MRPSAPITPVEIESISDLDGTKVEYTSKMFRYYDFLTVERHHKLPIKLTADSLVALLRLGLRGQSGREYKTRWKRAKSKRLPAPKVFGWGFRVRE